jgi:hypothetical protein
MYNQSISRYTLAVRYWTSCPWNKTGTKFKVSDVLWIVHNIRDYTESNCL